MKRLVLFALLFGCGDGTATVTVSLSASTVPVLNPFDPATGISKVRIRIDGVDQYDDAIIDLPLGQREATFEKFPHGMQIRVRADGYDAFGNVVAYGRADELTVEGDLNVTIPFRRNLAYVTHRPTEGQAEPQAHVYLIDMSTRTLVHKLRLPGTSPSARGISARGGDSILVTYDDGGSSYVGVLSADTNEVRQLRLMQSQSLAIASPASKTAVVAGGGVISFLDLETGANEVYPRPVGGKVLDAAISPDGERAIFVLDTATIDVRVSRREVKQVPILPDACGVSIGRDGRVAYLTSSTETSVGAINLSGEDAALLGGASFARPACKATFSDEMNGILAVNVNPSNGASRVIAMVVLPLEGLSFEEGTPSLNYPTAMASDGPGRRIILVAEGTSSEDAGLTVIDTFPDHLPDGSSTLYPLDPDDTYVSPGGAILRHRWRPADVAVIYGR